MWVAEFRGWREHDEPFFSSSICCLCLPRGCVFVQSFLWNRNLFLSNPVTVQSCDCPTVVGVPHVVRLVRTWSRRRSISSSWRHRLWSIVEFSSGVEVSDTWFIVEATHRVHACVNSNYPNCLFPNKWRYFQ